MFSKLLLLALIGLVAAGGRYLQDNRITLTRARANILNFACGAYGSDGSPTYNGDQSFTYTFNGHPSWLTARGSTLSGTPPANDNGPWYVSVAYQGNRYSTSGSNRYQLVPDVGASLTYASVGAPCDTVTYASGYPSSSRNVDASASSYVVLVPILTTTTQTTYVKQPDTIVQAPPVDCSSYQSIFDSATSTLTTDQATVNDLSNQLNNAQIQLSNAQALVNSLQANLTAAQSQIITDQTTVQQANLTLVSCQASQNAPPTIIPGKVVPQTQTFTTTSYAAIVVGGYSSSNCGSAPVTARGRGVISAVGNGYCIISGLGQVNFGDCTTKSYKRGRNFFAVSDSVTYETYQWGGKIWGRNLSCQ